MNANARKWGSRVLGAVAMAALSAWAQAATPVPSGRWSFVFNDAKGRADRPIRVYTYRPKKCDTTCPIMFLMAGEKRNAYDYLGWWDAIADNHTFILIAPEFSKDHWPRAAAYNLGGVGDEKNRERWAFSAIEHLFDEMRDGQKDYMIFGHSAGAQFVQRMAFFRPDNRASVMVVANPGWYTMPEWRKDKGAEAFPFSLLNSPAGEVELRQALARRVLLLVGEKDSDPDDEKLNQSSGAKKQGESRVERGENFIKAATAAAQDLGVKLGWEFYEVPETAHDAPAMGKAAADILFKKR
jgi:poly(3-hydroxybutyrate) depolymerase